MEKDTSVADRLARMKVKCLRCFTENKIKLKPLLFCVCESVDGAMIEEYACKSFKKRRVGHAKWCMNVTALDINMGYPKSFSISGGMGVALLTKPDLIHDILTTLKRNLDIHVTCKIRLLKSPQEAVELARRIEKTDVSALAVHGTKVADRPRDPAKWSEIADVVAAVSIPVIANGDVFELVDSFSNPSKFVG
ncbi:hypothetical protein BUALT_Bualt08G0038400 [Buddleja alternifolia]|uniref:DUS-like FMN-binding domain-containing protein n=1 Tax=Buddleja alternifolia TaxID=168488 RepID=A0AAV6XAP1_9LAMI|nr:hypothetical protein BUALT_Bualt08G0038400 [Buddleja alternifolia]